MVSGVYAEEKVEEEKGDGSISSAGIGVYEPEVRSARESMLY
jgi:hypothetical protein